MEEVRQAPAKHPVCNNLIKYVDPISLVLPEVDAVESFLNYDGGGERFIRAWIVPSFQAMCRGTGYLRLNDEHNCGSNIRLPYFNYRPSVCRPIFGLDACA